MAVLCIKGVHFQRFLAYTGVLVGIKNVQRWQIILYQSVMTKLKSGQNLAQQVDFDFVRYANLWEDADVLRRGLRIQSNERVLSIGSGGDNCFALLLDDPAIAVAADLNPAQLHIIELKMAAMRQLSYEQVLGFLGFRPDSGRSATFQRLQNGLTPAAQSFWAKRLPDVEIGVIHSGKFERYFRLFAHRILPWIHRKSTVEALLAPKSAAEQTDFYHNRWNTWRWRLLFKVFFGRWVMGKFGRDPEFLKEVKLSVGEYIFQKAATQLSNVQAQNNHILRYNLTGDYGHLLPDYLLPANYATVVARLDRMQLYQGYAQDAGAEYGPFDAMNLSDIFEYMDEQVFGHVTDALLATSRTGCRIAYWNLMVPRRISAIRPEQMAYLSDLSGELTRTDKGFFYHQFIVDRVI
jgi:S-adenosylmethionine-diacylglycerol 3-amino-3-carboxypropyl transferase